MFRKVLLLELWPKTEILKKVPKMEKIEVFPNFLKNDKTDFFYFLHEDRSNLFLTHGENCMSGKNLVREIFGPESGAG